jgi:outer membrane immunogenic protein
MKKLLLGAVGLVAMGISAPASAADLAARPYTKAPPPMVAPVYDWSGFYVGLNGGGGWSHRCWDLFSTTVTPGVVAPLPPGVVPTLPTLAPEGCHNSSGGTVGGQIGYRWQASNWVFGLEGQGNWADFRGSNTSLFFTTPTIPPVPPLLATPAFTNQSRMDAFGLLTGQVGYAWNNVLLYFKGGAAVTGNTYDRFVLPTGALFSSARDTRWGGTAGVGLEWGFAPNWSVAFEYDHLFMGNRNVTFTTATIPTTPPTPAVLFATTDRIRQDIDLATVRINYRWGGPVIGKY